MGKISQKIVKGLQLDHKWVRIMLTVSIIAVLIIANLPNGTKNEAGAPLIYDTLYKRINSKPILDTTITMRDSSTTRVLIRKAPVTDSWHSASNGWRFDSVRGKWIQEVRVSGDRQQPAPPPPPVSALEDKSVTDDSVKAATKTEPIQIQIVSEPKPFDWKGTITWMIGAINGLVLVVLNVKNLIVKKTP
jgi:hypothetical protein